MMNLTRRLMRLASGLLIASVVLTILSLPPWPAVHVSPVLAQDAATVLPTLTEASPDNNDGLTSYTGGTAAIRATAIGPTGAAAPALWQQTIRGWISSADDLDWYRLTLGPASEVTARLTNLPADYDLVLAYAPNGLAEGAGGLEDILDIGGGIGAIGGGIGAIGGGIGAIGGGIGAIGGGIGAIGGGIGAIGGGIGAISAQSGTTPEQIEIFLWQPGVYYLAVVSHNGGFSAQPYALQVRVAASELTVPQPAPDVQINLSDLPSGVNTLYIVNSLRMRELYGDDPAISELLVGLETLAGSAINPGYVLDLSTAGAFSTATVGTAIDIGAYYADWDVDPGNPLQANRLAELIDNVITAATLRNPSTPGATGAPLFPDVEYIVLVGGDGVIPFKRVPDLALLANEADYATYMQSIDPSGIIDPKSPLGAALRYRTLLTDNIYGSDSAYSFLGYPLYIPNRAVGRLVETPADMLAYIQPYLGQQSPLIDARAEAEAFVTGYDFLIDQALEVRDGLNGQGFQTTELITSTWLRSDLEREWFAGGLDSEFGTSYSPASRSPYLLQSLNAHFDHWQLIPADDSGGNFPARRILTPFAEAPDFNSYYTNRLLYSVGCHSGYNVAAAALAPGLDAQGLALYGADFPQAILKQGGTFIGNTGYGYGALDSVGYSERLAVLITDELARSTSSGGPNIGDVLAIAKQRYLRNTTSFGVYDAKVLQVMTLYGLPFIQVQVPSDNQKPPPPEERAGAPAETRLPSALTPDPVTNPLGRLERIITFNLDFGSREVPRTGSRYPLISNIAVEDSFVAAGFAATPAVRIIEAAEAGRPQLPQFAYDLSALNAAGERLTVRDVSLIGGEYSAVANYDPVVTQIVTETIDPLINTTTEPTFDADPAAWYPARFFGVSSVQAGQRTLDQLLVTAAQFKTAADGASGTLRPYTQITFRVSYSDPDAPQFAAAAVDTSPPQIETVRVVPQVVNAALQASSVNVIVEVSDQLFNGDDRSTGIASVEAVYAVNNQIWTRVTFTRDGVTATGGERWVAQLPVEPGAVRVIVSASDGAGNTATYTAKGSFQPPDPFTIHLPVVVR